jgi:H+/Cl- antiporter ClcA/CBS domain-containing protein
LQPHHEIQKASTTEGLPVAPSMGPTLASVPPRRRRRSGVDARVVAISACAVGVAACAGVIAQGLTQLIALITNISFYGRFSTAHATPAGNALGWFVVLVPMAGGLVVGLMARFGSAAIRGHGIPEAMEQVLFRESRIPARMTFLKPLSAAVSIGTGGPFGAEGPIIATGGALGSMVGQVLPVTADERKTLLAAGAAAGMAATFGTPVSAVLLAIELLLFEYRPRSLVPVALAAAMATGLRIAFLGNVPAFDVGDLPQAHGAALAGYVAIGALIGVASVLVTRLVYLIEDQFERLPIHWMWWPVLGAIPVGVVGYFVPRTLGVGYDNIEDVVSGALPLGAVALLCAAKLTSWAISLGSGTSGGTLAPLFTIGGALGALLGALLAHALPGLGLDPRIGALVGMAAIFAGASRALLASVVFAFEATHQPFGLLPLLGGCSAAFLVSSLLMRTSIMTEKIVRRGARVASEYSIDFLEQLLVRDVAIRPVVTVRADASIAELREWLAAQGTQTSHNGFPVVDAEGRVVGVVTRRELLGAPRPEARVGELGLRAPIAVRDDASLREAADLMLHEKVGRLPVVDRSRPPKLVGILTRSDLIEAHALRVRRSTRVERTLGFSRPAS